MNACSIDALAIGDGVTVHGWSDSHAYTVVEIFGNGRTAMIQRDKATRINADEDSTTPGGFFAHRESGPAGQQWSYEQDTDGFTQKITRRRDGRWYPVGASHPVSMGRHEHYDYNF